MMMIKCNDISSPPLWVLPLVHSPVYLSRLWTLAEQADAVGHPVPLQQDPDLDMEMEVLISNDSEIADLVTGKRKALQAKLPQTLTGGGCTFVVVAVSCYFLSLLCFDVLVDSLSALLLPSDGDTIIAKALRRIQVPMTGIGLQYVSIIVVSVGEKYSKQRFSG
jgi:hypothetical protein